LGQEFIVKKLILSFVLSAFWIIPIYSQGHKDHKNIAPLAKLETDGQDHPMIHINDENFDTRWNAKNDDVDTWIKFTWNKKQKINRVHVTEFRSRLRGHTIEYDESLKEAKGLTLKPDNADASANHPGNQKKPVVVPDHILTFDTVQTTILQYHVIKTTGASDGPSLWEIEIFFDPEIDTAPVNSDGLLTTIWANLKGQK
jgi:hypothetical protein